MIFGYFRFSRAPGRSCEGEELEPQKNRNVDLHTRLSNKLLAKQKKKLDEVGNIKKAEAEVEAHKREDCSIDDLLSFINGDGGIIIFSLPHFLYVCPILA